MGLFLCKLCDTCVKKAIKLCFNNSATTNSKGEGKGEILAMICGNEITEVIPQHKLPEDMIIEILSRLPVKSLMRFRCVCKRWYELSLSSAFIDIHLNNMDKKKGSIFYFINSDLTNKDYTDIYMRVNGAITSLRAPHIDWGSYIVGSSNGLVCISSFQGNYTLWNPATRQFECLPKLVYEDKYALWNPNVLISMSGFVFDGRSKDYKVVKIIVRPDLDRDTTQFNVFTLSSNSWRTIELNLQSQNRMPYSRSIVVNGCIYWTELLLLEEERNQSCLCWFNMVDEEFKQIQAPCDICDFVTTLDVYKGSLAMFVYKHPYDKFDMWVMNEHGDGTNYSWRKQLSIGPVAIITAEPIGIWKEDDDELVVFNNTGCGPTNLFTLHPITREIKKFRGDYPVDQIFPYCESLVRIPKLH